MSTAAPPCRLYGIVARNAPVAVVFRRGPSKWWHIIKWDLKNKRLEQGAWFKGNLYPRRSAISPDGKRLAYYALKGQENWQSPWCTFFGVSKVPWLTALVAWQTMGTCTQGAWFFDNEHLGIAGDVNHELFHGNFPGKVSNIRIPKDGFHLEQASGWSRPQSALVDQLSSLIPKRSLEFPSDRIVWGKKQRSGPSMLISVSDGVDFRKKSIEGWVVDYALASPSGRLNRLDDVAWGDWDHSDRMVVATRGGQLQIRVIEDDLTSVVWSADLNDIQRNRVPSPDWARRW